MSPLETNGPGPRYVPETRQLTGTPFVHHAYVLDRLDAKIVAACSHRHIPRNGKSGHAHALRCAERMVKAYQRKGDSA